MLSPYVYKHPKTTKHTQVSTRSVFRKMLTEYVG